MSLEEQRWEGHREARTLGGDRGIPLCAGHRLQPSGAGKAGQTHSWVPDPVSLDLRLAPRVRRGEASAVLSLLPRLWSPQEMMTWALGDLEGTCWHAGGWTVAVTWVQAAVWRERAEGSHSL